MLPPIRYPLPTLLVLLLLGVVTWRGERMTRTVRSSLAARWQRVVEGPPVPNSSHPQVVAGPIVRKVLLLHDDVAASDRPGGPPAQSIRLRMFADVYDVWPLQGEPEFFRVGNRSPIGWVKSADLLPWNTRLVVRKAAEGGRGSRPPSCPALSWSADSVEVALWSDDQPWQDVRTRERVPRTRLTAGDWGAWISREELLGLLRRIGGPVPEPPGTIRLRAILGRAADQRPLTAEDLSTARSALPTEAFQVPFPTSAQAGEALARINENWETEASWGGLSFCFLPLSTLP